MTCKVDNCTKEKWCRGWCKTHYERWRRLGSAYPDIPISRSGHALVKVTRTPEKREYVRTAEYKWNAHDRVLDWLSIDGGWLTREGIAHDLEYNCETVDRALRELRREGLVVSQVVEMAAAHRGGYESRTEWRAV